jgi:hypothetical protein
MAVVSAIANTAHSAGFCSEIGPLAVTGHQLP